MTAPKISVEFDGDLDCFRLMAFSYSSVEPAGPRLFRGGLFPSIAFTHETKEGADRDCELLQTYVTLAWQGKAPKAKGKEEQETAPKLSVWDLKNAVWMT